MSYITLFVSTYAQNLSLLPKIATQNISSQFHTEYPTKFVVNPMFEPHRITQTLNYVLKNFNYVSY